MTLPPDERELNRDPTWPCKKWGFASENVMELTPDQVALHALEPKLADVRRILLVASTTRTPLKPEVRALAHLAEELHHRVLRELVGEVPS